MDSILGGPARGILGLEEDKRDLHTVCLCGRVASAPVRHARSPRLRQGHPREKAKRNRDPSRDRKRERPYSSAFNITAKVDFAESRACAWLSRRSARAVEMPQSRRSVCAQNLRWVSLTPTR